MKFQIFLFLVCLLLRLKQFESKACQIETIICECTYTVQLINMICFGKTSQPVVLDLSKVNIQNEIESINIQEKNIINIRPPETNKLAFCLKVLTLINNKIENIDLNSFNQLIELTKLDLSANKIKTIKNEYFRNLSKLENLFLNKNEINDNDVIITFLMIVFP